MVLNVGEKIHVVTRRLFESDAKRHFVGEVEAAAESIVRLQGYVFVFEFNAMVNRFVRRPERRARIVSLTDSNNLINVIPSEVDLEELEYKLSPKKHLVITDNKAFSLDINEFGSAR
jgi:hypothetical protein